MCIDAAALSADAYKTSCSLMKPGLEAEITKLIGLPPRSHSKNKHPKKFEGEEKGLSAASNVADSPSPLIVPPALPQLVKLKGVIFAPVTLMFVEVISESA